MKHTHETKDRGYLKNIILGGQDGLVNVLGIVLGVATAVQEPRIILLAGLAATFAESFSMAAVGYTSIKAAQDYYKSRLHQEEDEVAHNHKAEHALLLKLYAQRGFSGNLLNRIVHTVSKDRKLWVETIMSEQLHLNQEEYRHPLRDGMIIGLAAIIGSLIPILPFFFSAFISVNNAILLSVVLSATALYITGFQKAKLTIGTPWKAGVSLAIIGLLAAGVGYLVGVIFKVV